ncbi:MAG: patatin-like phospholipase family protein [Myxococcota bacterium]
MATDIVLSSGFLAFARHVGFLRAVEEAGLEAGAVCGTSSGALVGALWAAGLPARDVAEELSTRTPLSLMRPHGRPWRGVFSLERILGRLRQLLPPRFEDLGRPFAAGVAGPGRTYRLLRSGPLPESVAASCAMPAVFAPVEVDGVAYSDGGAVDRVGLAAVRRWRGGARPTIVHLVERTAGRQVDEGLEEVVVVRTPRSGARFWSLGDFDGQVEEARRLARAVLRDDDAAAGEVA